MWHNWYSHTLISFFASFHLPIQQQYHVHNTLIHVYVLALHVRHDHSSHFLKLSFHAMSQVLFPLMSSYSPCPCLSHFPFTGASITHFISSYLNYPPLLMSFSHCFASSFLLSPLSLFAFCTQIWLSCPYITLHFPLPLHLRSLLHTLMHASLSYKHLPRSPFLPPFLFVILVH